MREAVRLAAAGLAAPCGVIDLDAFDRNVAAIARRAAGKPIRVASKSLRVPRAIHRVLEHPAYAGVLAFTLPEALELVRRGVRDVVLGYPVVGRDALRELRADARARERITLMIDSVSQLDYLDAATAGREPVRVAIDLDVSLRPFERALGGAVHIGARRSSVREAEQAAVLARSIRARAGVRLVGAMAYEAQVAGVGDAAGGLTGAVTRKVRAASIRDIARRRAAMIAAIEAEVGSLEFVNGGGTGSLETTAAEAAVTELTVGSGFFSPALFDGYRWFRHEAAAFFGVDVVRKPREDIATLHGGGWVASGAAGADRLPVVAWPAALRLTALEGAGRCRLPWWGMRRAGLAVGDRVWLRHAKAGS